MTMLPVYIGSVMDASLGRKFSVGTLISLFLTGAVVVAGIVLLFFLVGGGLKMIQSAGSGDAKGAASGKESVMWAIIGFIVVFAAYWIIRIVEDIVGTRFLTNPLFGRDN